MSKRKFQDGQFATINSKAGSHIISVESVGAKVKVLYFNTGNYNADYKVRAVETGREYWVSAAGMDHVAAVVISTRDKFMTEIAAAEKKIFAAEEQIREYKDRISFLDETGSEEWNENEFKAYRTLTIIEQSEMTKLDKAKAIAALIQGK